MFAIPLCPDCHRTGAASAHSIGEDAFFRRFGKGEGYGPRLAAMYLAAYVTQQDHTAT